TKGAVSRRSRTQPTRTNATRCVKAYRWGCVSCDFTSNVGLLGLLARHVLISPRAWHPAPSRTLPHVASLVLVPPSSWLSRSAHAPRTTARTRPPTPRRAPRCPTARERPLAPPRARRNNPRDPPQPPPCNRAGPRAPDPAAAAFRVAPPRLAPAARAAPAVLAAPVRAAR